jgi:hypothetical protein
VEIDRRLEGTHVLERIRRFESVLNLETVSSEILDTQGFSVRKAGGDGAKCQMFSVVAAISLWVSLIALYSPSPRLPFDPEVADRPSGLGASTYP